MSFSSFPKFQLFVLSGIHYCKHLTFVFVLCWSQGEQEGEFVSSSLPWIAGTLLGHVFLDLLMRESFMYGEKIDTFLNLFGSSDGVHLKICIGYFVTKKYVFLFRYFILRTVHILVFVQKKINTLLKYLLSFVPSTVPYCILCPVQTVVSSGFLEQWDETRNVVLVTAVLDFNPRSTWWICF